MNKLKIAIVQGAFLPIPPLKGGAVEKMYYSLSQEFKKQGHEVIHISKCYDSFPTYEIVNGIEYIRIKGYETPKSGIILKFLDLLYSLRVKKVLINEYDAIITNTFWLPIILPKKIKFLCVVDVQRMPKGQMKFYLGASRLRANSNVVSDAIKSEIPLKCNDKVIMIPNPLPFKIDKKINLLDKKKNILYVGRIHPEKGIDILIRAYKTLRSNFKLQIVGPWKISDGGGGREYFDKLKELTIDTDIEFVGSVFDINLLSQYYHGASIFVYPSVAEKGETFGLAPLEAMAWGCVPVVSDLLCFKDFIKEKDNGLVFNHRAIDAVTQLASCLQLLENNDDLRNNLAINAMNVNSSHSVSTIAEEFIKEFQKMKIK